MRAFRTGLEVIRFCLEHGIANMQILVHFADPRMNLAVSVTDLSEELSPSAGPWPDLATAPLGLWVNLPLGCESLG